MLFKLSLKNIKKSLKDYAIYFFTLVLGVAIFYVFNSLESQTIMLNVSSRIHELIPLLLSALGVLSVFVSVVLGFLILYASRFLMKRRKKEFGIYMTLGMGKGQISRILLIENFLIGLISLAVGLVLGILASQLMSVFVANLFEADMTHFQFIFSPQALMTTIGMFAIIFVIVILFSTISVGRQKLINLISADKQGEKIKVKNLALSIVIFLVAAALLIFAYIGVTANLENLTPELLVIYIICGILGTFLLFWSWSGIVLRIVSRIKSIYYKNLNPFIFRELDSKINTTVISMSVISLLLFLTIGIFSVAMTLRNSATENLQTLVPVDFEAYKFQNPKLNADNQLSREDRLTAIEVMAERGIDLDTTFRDYEAYSVYQLDSLTYKQTMADFVGGSVADLTPEDIADFLDNQEDIMHLSDYNRVARYLSFETIDLEDDEYAIIANYDIAIEIRNKSLAAGTPITINGHTLTPSTDHVYDGIVEMNASPANVGVIIVPDQIELDSYSVLSRFLGNYKLALSATNQEIQEFEASLVDRLNQSQAHGQNRLVVDSRQDIYGRSIGTSAMVTFIGLYLGTIFLISSAALLGLKEIAESTDNQQKYLTLRQLGTDQRTLNHALLTQLSIFFGLPLLVAIIHSIFGILFVHQTLLAFTQANLLLPITITALFILVIYGGYFIITYLTSKRIIMGRD